MKRLMILVAVVALVFGVNSTAMAWYNVGDFQLFAYEGSYNDTDGNILHYDLGMGMDTETAAASIDTGITLEGYSTDTWSEVHLAIFGGGYDNSWEYVPAYMAISKDYDADDLSVKSYSSYADSVASYSNEGDFDDTDRLISEEKASSDFNTYFSCDYNGMLRTDGTLTLADDSVLSFNFYTYDGTDQSTFAQVGTFTVDTTSGSMVLSYNPVPVPGALILMCTGLLSLVGVTRRKNA